MHSRIRRLVELVSLVTAFAGCSTAHDVPHLSAPVGSVASLVVGPEGGTIEVGDARIRIAAGALREEHEVRVTVTSDEAPSAFGRFSPIYQIEPANLELAIPATITLPFEGRGSVATVFHRNERVQAYIAESTAIADDLAEVELSQLGRLFVGSGSSGEGSCRAATSELDVLLAVDNSGSMTEEQAALVAELPRLAQVLATGDIDADGIQDFPAASSIHWGNITTDLGAGAYPVPTCNGVGDDGLLRTAGSATDASCAPTYPSVLEYDLTSPSADPSLFAHDVACVASAGVNGCGFEQPLEAELKALTPSASPLVFFGGASGQGDLANAGLVREGSVLAVINLTDEDDGSSADPELFDPNSSTYAGDLNLRNYQNPSALHSVLRYVDGLLALRADPSRLVFAAVAGVPQDLVADASSIDYSTVLADPRMAITFESGDTGIQVASACTSSSGGRAFPAQRIVQTAQALDASGAATIVQSICDENLDNAVNAIVNRIASRLAGSCE